MITKLINQLKLLFFKKKNKTLSTLTKQERYNIYLKIKEHLVERYFKDKDSSFCYSLHSSLLKLNYYTDYNNEIINYFPELMYYQLLDFNGGYWFSHISKEGYEKRLKIINQIISDYETIN